MYDLKTWASSRYEAIKPLVPQVLLLAYFAASIGHYLFPDYADHDRSHAKELLCRLSWY
jgi:hypothetical protein